jgi:hypothetical protein
MSHFLTTHTLMILVISLFWAVIAGLICWAFKVRNQWFTVLFGILSVPMCGVKLVWDSLSAVRSTNPASMNRQDLWVTGGGIIFAAAINYWLMYVPSPKLMHSRRGGRTLLDI